MIYLTALTDLLLSKVFSNLDKSNQKSASLVCKIFQNIINNNEAGYTALIISRQGFIDKFFLKKVPGLNISYGQIFDIFNKNGIDIYVSGGAIRDLLGIRSSSVIDIDFSFTGNVEKIVEIAKENFWQFSKRPDFPVIQIGIRKDCCLQGISVDYTLKAPIESLDFCLNNITYHYNAKQLIDRTGKGFDAIFKQKLNIPLEDREKWLGGEVFGSIYNKIFRTWKMLGRGYGLEPSLHSFLYSKTIKFLQTDRQEFLENMIFYLGRDYDDYDSYLIGSGLLMGNKWKNEVITPLENEILSSFKNKEELWESYTFNNK